MIRKGDKVIMNGKYYVSEKNKDKEFIVSAEPTEVCGTLSVWLGKLSSIASSLSNRSNTPLTVDAVSSAAPVQDITNSHGNGWVYVEGMGRMTWDELESEIDNGKVVETMKNGVYTYRKA